MKFLTSAWHRGDFSDEQSDAIYAAYLAHQREILPQLPADVEAFARTVNVHDGLLRGVMLDRPGRILRLAMLCGDPQAGSFNLELEYRGVEVQLLDVAVLRVIAHERRPEALYDEVDLFDEGRYTHRWLWWPFCRELDVHFAAMSFKKSERRSRGFVPARRRFVERT